MPKTSSYLDIAEALRAQLVIALPDVQVMRGIKLDRNAADYISIGGIEAGSHDIPTMKAGRKDREEDYDLMVELVSSKAGASVVAAETRVFDLFDALENLLANDPSIGFKTDVTNYHGLTIQIGEYDLNSVYDEQRSGWRAMMSLRVHVNVRLR